MASGPATNRTCGKAWPTAALSAAPAASVKRDRAPAKEESSDSSDDSDSSDSDSDDDEVTEKTKKALEALVSAKVAAAMPVHVAEKQAPAQYISYTPAHQGGEFNSGATQRIIGRGSTDPMSPPRFK